MYNLTFVETGAKKYHHYHISNQAGGTMAIYPEYGAALMYLEMHNKVLINNVIKDESAAPAFLNSSCSVVLFPFANRIKDGKYTYEGVDYQLECNETKLGHALHGLVNKASFELADFKSDSKRAIITFTRKENNPPAGFPFPFVLQLRYTLEANKLTLSVKATNIGKQSFPFSLGWHPYFYSSNLDESSVEIVSNQKIVNDDRMIPVEVAAADFPNPLLLVGHDFDNSFVLQDTKVVYRTPDYALQVNTLQDQSQQYIHFYTPSHRQSIAIEPMTAAADCFNNMIGLKELSSGENFQLDWTVELF